MTLNTTRWSPDSCGCVLEYAWDTATSEDDRVHTHVNTVAVCVSHAELHPDPATVVAEQATLDAWETSGRRGARPKTPHIGLTVHEQVGKHSGPPLFAQVLNENQTVQFLRSWVAENVERLRDPNGDLTADVIQWATFTGSGRNRAVDVEFVGANLTTAEKAQLDAYAKTLPVAARLVEGSRTGG